MWDVWNVGYLQCVMFKLCDVWDVGYSGSAMFGMLGV